MGLRFMSGAVAVLEDGALLTLLRLVQGRLGPTNAGPVERRGTGAFV